MDKLIQIAEQLGACLLACRQMLTTAESCTGGGVAQALTSVSGSSNWFERGFVTYSNMAKQEMLGVKAMTLTDFGAVSEAVVREMAQGALDHSQADISLAITGVAGPEGGSAANPVGTVFFAWAGDPFGIVVEKQLFSGDRLAVREQAVAFALQRLLDLLLKS